MENVKNQFSSGLVVAYTLVAISVLFGIFLIKKVYMYFKSRKAAQGINIDLNALPLTKKSLGILSSVKFAHFSFDV